MATTGPARLRCPCRLAGRPFSLFSRAAQGCIRGTANQGRRYLRAYPSAPLEAMRYGGLNRVRRFPSGCILCGKKDKVGLIAPCECYKKNDTGQVHIACLKRLIQNQREDDEKLTCPTCKKEYKIDVIRTFNWSWGRFCSCTALHNVFEFFAICLTFLCFLFSTYIVFKHEKEKHDPKMHHRWDGEEDMGPKTQVFFCIMVVVMIGLVYLTLKKVYGRWEKTQVDIEVCDAV